MYVCVCDSVCYELLQQLLFVFISTSCPKINYFINVPAWLYCIEAIIISYEQPYSHIKQWIQSLEMGVKKGTLVVLCNQLRRVATP